MGGLDKNMDTKGMASHPMLSSLPPSRMKKGKIVQANEAIQVIRDKDSLVVGGFVGAGVPEELLIALEEWFLANNSPKDLTLIYTAGIGDGKDRGLNRLAHPGLLKRVIGGHWGLVPKLQKLALENQIEAYNLPQGVIAHMYRDIAAKKPATFTTVGMGTFVDPEIEGGKINRVTTEDIVERITIKGKTYLAYQHFPVNVAILRGTTADTEGNITMEKEALTLESLAIAIAVKNADGFVMVQVERIAERGTLHPKQVKIPGIMVDCVVVAKPENHHQTLLEVYNPGFSGELRVPTQSVSEMEMNERKVIARRAAFELAANSVVNLGIGMPEGIANVAHEEKIIDLLTLTAEPGVIGGIPAGGLNFGAATNTEAIIDQPYQFDFYDGGGLDMAFLGLAQTDRHGNLNVSRFGPKLAGAGGFINISQNAKKVIFVGTFTAGGLEVAIEDGKLEIISEGRVKKFIHEVEQITFSGKYAVETGQPVLYVTERCVFRLTEKGMELAEIAPGVDVEKHILSQMGFSPLIPGEPGLMDPRIFSKDMMNLKDDLLSISLKDRLSYDPEKNLFFVNFEQYAVKTPEDVQEIEDAVSGMLAPLDKKVYTIVNYDNFTISPEMVDAYTQMVKRLVYRYYTDVTRYTTSAFLRMKLGDALSKRAVSPHIYESREEAETALGKG